MGSIAIRLGIELDAKAALGILGHAGAPFSALLDAGGPLSVAVLTGTSPTDGSEDTVLDPSVASVFLAQALPHAAFLLDAGIGREHPFNWSRRVASLQHLTGGRVGWLIGDGDTGTNPWSHAEHGDVADASGEVSRSALAEAVALARQLWASWPAGTLTHNKSAESLVDVSTIVRVNHDGVHYTVAGPLSVPGSRHGSPVVAIPDRVSKTIRRIDPLDIDLAIVALVAVDEESVAALLPRLNDGALVVLTGAAASAAGVDAAVRAFTAHGVHVVPNPGGPLRARLGLGARTVSPPPSASPAFAGEVTR